MTNHSKNSGLRPRRVLSACLLSLFLGHAGGVLARQLSDAEASQLPLEALLDVEVYSPERYVRRLSGAASAATVVTSEDIRRFGYRTLSDVLKSLPGLYVAYDRNYSYLGSRGVGKPGDWNSRILVLVDGHRINENIYDGAYIGHDFPVDMSLVDRVDYVAGPAAAMFYGNNAFYGVVNVVTKTGSQMNGGTLAVGAGSGDSRHVQAAYGRRSENGLEVLLSASGYRSAGRDLSMPELGGVAHGLDDERADRVFAKFGLGGFNLQIAHAERFKGIPNASYAQDFGDSRSHTVDRQTHVDLKYEHALGAESAVSGRLFFGEYLFHGDYIYGGASLPDDAQGRWWGADLKYVGSPLAGHRLLLGLDAQSDLRRWQRGDLDPAQDRRGQRWALYAHDAIALGNAFTLDIGGRYDHVGAGVSRFNPRLGLIYAWSPATTLKALYGSAFRAPNVYERFYVADANLYNNPALKPETIVSREVALTHQFAGGGSIAATLFRNASRDTIVAVPLPPPDIAIYGNAGKMDTQGIELRYEQPLAEGGRFQASYTGQRSRDQAGATPENSPRHLAKLNWRQPLFATGLHAGLEAQYVGARRSYAGSKVGGDLFANLTLSGTFYRNLDLALTVANFLNRRLYDPAPDYLAPIERVRLDGRSWYLNAIYRF